MGQESSHHASAGRRSEAATENDSANDKRGSKFRKGAQMLKHVSGSVSKRSGETEIPTVKKAKLPEGGALPTAKDSQARERLLSCPDFHHHSESEMVKRLEKLLVPKVTLEPAPAGTHADAKSHALLKLFDGANPPKITIAQYLQRMLYYLGGIAENERNCGVDANVHSDLAVRYLLTAILYMERIQTRTGMVVTMYNTHRLLITGTMIAAKVLDDFQPNQKYFADLGGVSPIELSRLEAAFLQLCDYNVNVDPDMFAEKYATALERERVFSDVNEALTLGAVFSPKMPHRTIPAV